MGRGRRTPAARRGFVHPGATRATGDVAGRRDLLHALRAGALGRRQRLGAWVPRSRGTRRVPVGGPSRKLLSARGVAPALRPRRARKSASARPARSRVQPRAGTPRRWRPSPRLPGAVQDHRDDAMHPADQDRFRRQGELVDLQPHRGPLLVVGRLAVRAAPGILARETAFAGHGVPPRACRIRLSAKSASTASARLGRQISAVQQGRLQRRCVLLADRQRDRPLGRTRGPSTSRSRPKSRKPTRPSAHSR